MLGVNHIRCDTVYFNKINDDISNSHTYLKFLFHLTYLRFSAVSQQNAN